LASLASEVIAWFRDIGLAGKVLKTKKGTRPQTNNTGHPEAKMQRPHVELEPFGIILDGVLASLFPRP
jgi:hypothetical protein